MSTVQALVFSALTGDSALNALGVDANSCWAAGSMEGPEPTPFVALRWGSVRRGYGATNSSYLTIYVHDDPGNYDRINAILLRARAVMLALYGTGTVANWITSVEWLGDSGELSDDAYRTIMRNAEFNIVANTL